MHSQRPFRFGVQITRAVSAAAWIEKARRAETLGYAVLTMPDHFGAQLSPTPALIAAATATTSLRVGTYVYGAGYRHPVACAKEAATIDLLSDGRLELGLGAGWNRDEYDLLDLTFEPASARLSRLEEAVRVIKGCFAPEPLTFAGSYFAVSGYDGQPKPLQQPHPPILIGGGGPRLLAIAGREADIVGLAYRANPDGTPDVATLTASATEEKIGWVRAAAGERFATLELNAYVWFVIITDDRAGAAEKVATDLPGFSGQDALQTPHALIGTADQIEDELLARRERYGISYVTIQESNLDALAPVVARLAGR